MDLMHSDLCGPMTAPSLGGCFYYMIFIDDFSRKTCIYFMKAKSETFAKFQVFNVNDTAASEDILERLSCIKPFREIYLYII